MKPVTRAGVSPEIQYGSATNRRKDANQSTEFSELLSRQEARLQTIGQHVPEEKPGSAKGYGNDPESASESTIAPEVPCTRTVETNELVPDDLTAFQGFVSDIVSRIDKVALREDEANLLDLPAARSFGPDPVQHAMPDVHGLLQDASLNSFFSESASLPDQVPDASESEQPLDRSGENATEGSTAQPDVQSSVQTGDQTLRKPSDPPAVQRQDPSSRHAADLAVERMDVRMVENRSVHKPTAHAEIKPAPAQDSRPPAFVGNDLARQVASAVLRNRQNGESRLTVRLKPDQWGTLEIQLIRSEDGLLARIQSDRPETCQLLRERIPLLQESLHSPGAASRVEIQYQESASGGMTFGRDRSASQQGSDGRPEPLSFRQPDPDRPTAVDRARPLASHRPTNGRLIDRWA